MTRIGHALFLAAVAVAACQPAPQQEGAESTGADSAAVAAAEDRIHELNQQWVRAVAEKDTATIVQLYAADGRIMPPGQPSAVGHEALRQAWGGVLGMTDSLTFSTEVVEVAATGGMAYDVGTYHWAYTTRDGQSAEDQGKYLVVWVKRDGEWKVAADMFNSNRMPAGDDGGS